MNDFDTWLSDLTNGLRDAPLDNSQVVDTDFVSVEKRITGHLIEHLIGRKISIMVLNSEDYYMGSISTTAIAIDNSTISFEDTEIPLLHSGYPARIIIEDSETLTPICSWNIADLMIDIPELSSGDVLALPGLNFIY